MTEEFTTHELNGVYKNTNTGVHFTAHVDEEADTVIIAKEHEKEHVAFTTKKSLSSFKFNATITGAYKQIKTEIHETIEAFTELLCDPITVQALDGLLTYEQIPITAESIAETQSTRTNTVTTAQADRAIQKLVEYGIAEETTVTDFEHDAYRLNESHPLTESLQQLHLNLQANNDMFKNAVKHYVTGMWTNTDASWFTELFTKQDLLHAIELLLAYPENSITVQDLVTLPDINDNNKEDVVQALLTLNVISEDKSTIDMRVESISDVENTPVTVTITDSFLQPLHDGLHNYHADIHVKANTASK